MADTGYWRVGEAALGNQPEGAIWSKLFWDPCHGVFTGPFYRPCTLLEVL